MKLKLIFLGFLCLLFSSLALAQELKIGDTLPDVILRRVTGLKVSGKPVATVNTSAFRGKLLLLDFWATWCAPCRNMVPRLDSLQKAFKDELVVLPVSYESLAVVKPVLASLQKIRPFDLPLVSSDTVLHKYFPHRSLPHYVWIDRSGVIRAITGETEVNAATVRTLLKGIVLNASLKRDSVTAYNNEAPLFVEGNGGSGNTIRYHQLLTGFTPGLSGGLRISSLDPVKGQLFTVRNVPFTYLCRLAFAENGRLFPDAQIAIDSKDSLSMTSKLSGQPYLDWLASGHGYCYELLLPPQLSAQAFPMLQQNLARLFPAYRVSVEMRSTKCLALVRINDQPNLVSKGGERIIDIGPYSASLRNAPLSSLMQRLRIQYLQSSALPLVDLTGLKANVDLRIDARLYDLSSLNNALAAYGLRFEPREAEVEMLVIRDAPSS